MAIIYRKMVDLLQQKGVTSYTLKKYNIVGQSAWQKIQNNGNLDMRSIDALCKYLNCQPGDLLEYVPDEPEA